MNRVITIAMLALPLGLGCDFKRALDVEKVEASIEEGIEDQMGVKVDEVDCPEEVWETKGESFKCKVETKDGETIKVEVEMKGDGKVKWETVGPKPESKDDEGEDESAEEE